MATIIPQRGLVWEEGLLHYEPNWSEETDISTIRAICRRTLALPESECQVELYSEGGFNKLYKVISAQGTFMMRVALPVDPKHKTLSGIATMEFARRNSKCPVPRVVAYDASADNELGFEWILMEFIPGKPLYDVWWTIPWSTKEKLVKQLALYAAQLYAVRFDAIGSLFLGDSAPEDSTLVAQNEVTVISVSSKVQQSTSALFLGRTVDRHFFWHRNIHQEVHREPFNRISEWLLARLQLSEIETRRWMAEEEDDPDLKLGNKILHAIERLRLNLPMVFPNDQVSVCTVVVHSDLSAANILVDGEGNLKAVIDWEFSSAVPYWAAVRIPKFINDVDRADKPDEETYAHCERVEVTTLYWEHLRHYEETQLRKLWLAEMEQLEPAWIEAYKIEQTKAGFEAAVAHCESELSLNKVKTWLDVLERDGEPTHF
ncbi:kinase-like protein [Rhizodiscina lignyota]|uniref:non-specific serine/threonine protein kinase n=1 Tax=Rhizodiscina lignyota TaxID=1504668 RepID=A0A9P4IEH2_9PEZI|nr:kinase-like protein [Rhizodiscina lignyota]